MRLRLVEGKQRELIELAKAEKPWRELSKKLGLALAYIRTELRREKRLLSAKAYNQLCDIAGKSYNKYIIDKLDDNWGRSKGGMSPNSGYTKEIILPEDSPELSEFYGIMLGDGNLTIIKGYRIGTYQIKIVGDSRSDKVYLEDYVKPLIQGLFGVNVKMSKQKNKNAIILIATGKKLAEFLQSKGFKPGDKIRNQLEIPSWIKNNPDFLKACLRGLYDTDGSVYQLTNQNSYQILFTNYNSTLLNQARESLLSLGIGVSQISRGRDITITRKSELRKFLNEVGFSNVKHLDKVKKWNLAL